MILLHKFFNRQKRHNYSYSILAYYYYCDRQIPVATYYNENSLFRMAGQTEHNYPYSRHFVRLFTATHVTIHTTPVFGIFF